MTEPEIDPNYSVLDESEEYLAISKSGNCPVHEGGLYKENCLVRLLEKALGYRVYPVFRLDRETSGVIVLAKKREFVKTVFDSIIYKEYVAVCKGKVDAQLIDKPIGECKGEHIRWKKCISPDGKESKTFVEPLMEKDGLTLVKVIPLTGRQHQIRVHLSSIGCPIVDDKVYGESDKWFKDYLEGIEVSGRQLLHMHKIVLEDHEIVSKLPIDISKLFF